MNDLNDLRKTESALITALRHAAASLDAVGGTALSDAIATLEEAARAARERLAAALPACRLALFATTETARQVTESVAALFADQDGADKMPREQVEAADVDTRPDLRSVEDHLMAKRNGHAPVNRLPAPVPVADIAFAGGGRESEKAAIEDSVRSDTPPDTCPACEGSGRDRDPDLDCADCKGTGIRTAGLQTAVGRKDFADQMVNDFGAAPEPASDLTEREKAGLVAGVFGGHHDPREAAAELTDRLIDAGAVPATPKKRKGRAKKGEQS
jgi:hypothetical protein